MWIDERGTHMIQHSQLTDHGPQLTPIASEGLEQPPATHGPLCTRSETGETVCESACGAKAWPYTFPLSLALYSQHLKYMGGAETLISPSRACLRSVFSQLIYGARLGPQEEARWLRVLGGQPGALDALGVGALPERDRLG